jgi:competence protein ComGC
MGGREMRMKNKKGFTGFELVAIIGVIGLISYFAVPNIGKGINSIVSGDKNQTKASRVIQSERTLYQVDPQHPDKLIPVKDKYSDTSYQSVATEPPETLWEKFWKLGAIAIVIIVVLAYLGLWPIITVWWNKVIKPKIEKAKADLEAKTEEYDGLHDDAALIVKSIDEGLGAINISIASAEATMKTAQAVVSTAESLSDSDTTKSATIASSKAMLARATDVYNAVSGLKASFLTAMSRKQDSTTKLLVATLKND